MQFHKIQRIEKKILPIFTNEVIVREYPKDNVVISTYLGFGLGFYDLSSSVCLHFTLLMV